MTDIMIEFTDVSKSFIYSVCKNKTLKDWVVYRNKYQEKSTSTVLSHVTFKVMKGDCLGIVGKNGAGKSTILKLLSKIYYPNSGTIATYGKISSLIELGAGFHPELTGRENIRVNAAIHGLSSKEIDEKIDTIINFSEIGSYIDEPIKIYSSGMYMRLAFSIAINLDAEILLVDEILAVGDIYFQKKCFEKLQQLKSNGITIVLISHSPQQIIDICNRAIWIDDGVIKSEGDPKSVCEAYTHSLINMG